MISRRAFLTTTAAALLVAPLTAEAQRKGKVRGLASWPSPQRQPGGRMAAGFAGSQLDEGQNIIVEYRYSEGRDALFSDFASDPIASGFVASLARPGGNVTGMPLFADELAGKRLELLRR
jgi:hypothetical protein